MATLTHTEVNSQALHTLQDELLSLSDKLNDLYDILCGNLKSLGNEWTDEKWDEFDDEFKDEREKVIELSEKYKDWAEKYIQRRIEQVEDFGKTNAGIR